MLLLILNLNKKKYSVDSLPAVIFVNYNNHYNKHYKSLSMFTRMAITKRLVEKPNTWFQASK